MDTREHLAHNALALIDEQGLPGFTTRSVCARSGVTAPTLYHHFGDADGLLDAAVSLGFEQFMQRKRLQPHRTDPELQILAGWDDYVAFARERPQLYLAMSMRMMEGRNIAAARESREHLLSRLERLAATRRLAHPIETIADILWATVHAASMLHVRKRNEKVPRAAIAALRDTARRALQPVLPSARSMS
jgi:AcrR family transcriptional regulator